MVRGEGFRYKVSTVLLSTYVQCVCTDDLYVCSWKIFPPSPYHSDSPQRKSTISSAKRLVSFSNHAPSLSSRQPGWSRPQQSKLVKELVLELSPERVLVENPCLPAHMIHVGLRYCRHVTGSCGVAMGFLDEVASAIQQVVQV